MPDWGRMQVAQLWQYPVKSMIGATVDQVRLGPLGIEGDRGWAVRDLDRGGIRGAKKIGELMQLTARYLSPDDPAAGVQMTTRDGAEISSTAPDADARLSDVLGRTVRLEALRPAEDLDHYRRGAADSDDMMAELREVFGREEDEPLPDLAQFPPEIIEYESPPGAYYDVFPLMLMSTSSLAALAGAVPEAVVDVRRFRPSMVIETDALGHPEFGWTGQAMSVGDAELEILGPCPRCVMVTREISDDIPQDRSILRHIVAELDQNVGVYARVISAGTVSVGDRVQLHARAGGSE